MRKHNSSELNLWLPDTMPNNKHEKKVCERKISHLWTEGYSRANQLNRFSPFFSVKIRLYYMKSDNQIYWIVGLLWLYWRKKIRHCRYHSVGARALLDCIDKLHVFDFFFSVDVESVINLTKIKHIHVI